MTARATFTILVLFLFGCSEEPIPATPDAATPDQGQPDASAVDSKPAREAEGECVPFNSSAVMPIVGLLGPWRKTLPLPALGDDIPMDVLGSFTTLLELASADAATGLQINHISQIDRRAPVPLPLLEPGHKVLLSLRQWGGYANYQWFVVIRDAGSRELLLAIHVGNLELFDGDVFRESKALGFGFSLSETCQRYDPQIGCTSKGGYVTELAIEVNAGEGAGSVRISSGEMHTITVDGREHSVWLGGARRVQTSDTVGCGESAPSGGLGMAVW